MRGQGQLVQRFVGLRQPVGGHAAQVVELGALMPVHLRVVAAQLRNPGLDGLVARVRVQLRRRAKVLLDAAASGDEPHPCEPKEGRSEAAMFV